MRLLKTLREKLSPGFLTQLGDPAGNPDIWLALLLQGELRGLGDAYSMPPRQLAARIRLAGAPRQEDAPVQSIEEQLARAAQLEIQVAALEDRRAGSKKIALMGIFFMFKQRKTLAMQQPRRGQQPVGIAHA